MLSVVRRAAGDVFSPPFRGVLFKSLGITILALVAAWFGLEMLIDHLVQLETWWLDGLIQIVSGLTLLVAAVFLVVPITALVATLFLDDIAEVVEKTHYPNDPSGEPLPVLAAIRSAIGFTLVVIGVNLVALMLLLVPGINAIIFLVANGYLLGREYFELAAFRFRPRAEANALRRVHGGRVFLAGLVITGLLAVPILNLLTPLFATSLMVHLHKDLSTRRTS
ncbi:MAG: sulfate transporter family protein [Cohaesibacteraceae bacterium]